MIIYTTITNAYDRIPDHYYDPDVKYVLFYDEDIEQKGPWEFIRIPKGGDPVSKSYRIRTLSHLYFDEPHVWADACYPMTHEFVKTSKELLGQHSLVFQKHPEPRTLLREFCKIYSMGFVSEEKIYRCAEDIVLTGYKPSMFDHTINCAIWRQVTPQVIDFNVEYWRWYSKYELNRGDQIISGLAQYLAFGKNVPRVPLQFNLSKSYRMKPYDSSYKLVHNENDLNNFIKTMRRILGAAF